MATITCPSCGERIEAGSFMCPHCGYSLSSTPSVAPGPRRGPSRPPGTASAFAPPMPVRGRTGHAPGPADMPAANPRGGGLTADEILLGRGNEGATLSGAIADAWQHFKAAPFELVVIFIVVGLPGASEYLWDVVPSGPGTAAVTRAALIAVQIAALALQNVLTAGAIVYWLKLIRGQGPGLGDLGAGFRFLVPLIVTSLIAGLAVMAGLLLLVIPGVILGLGLYFVAHVIVDKNLGYIEAMRASWRITRGYKLDLFLLSLLSSLVVLLGVVACGVGVLVASPVVFGAFTVAYDRLAEPGNAYLE